MKRRMRNRMYGVVGGDGRYPVLYPIAPGRVHCWWYKSTVPLEVGEGKE